MIKLFLLALLLLLARMQASGLQFHCVKGCHCNRHQFLVVCSRGGLSHIPRFSHLTRSLNLNDNSLLNLKLHRFSTGPFEPWQLSELSIKRNNLTSEFLSQNNFELFSKLKVLRLDGNNITHLPGDLFSKNPELERLSLANNPLVISDPSSLQGLNSPSILYNLRYLDLSRTHLNNQSLPAFFSNFSSLNTLLLQGTTIHHFDSDFTSVLASISSLRRIDLSQAVILAADDSAFDNFEQLSEVDLSGTRVELQVFESIIHSLNSTSVEVLNLDRIFVSDEHNNHIPHNLFHRYHASSLNVLNLDGNSMAFRNGKLPEKLLHPLKHLTDLYLDHCNLISIPSKAFQNLNYLRKLSLKGNLLSCTQGSSCQFLRGSHMKHLKYLDLSNNRMCNQNRDIHFSEKVFPSLQFLDLKYNNLEVIGVNMLKSLTRLLQLDLSHNVLLHELEANAFEHLSFLTTLNLEGSKHLSHLRQGVFNGLTSLRVLNLRDSSLVHVHHSTFSHLYQLEELYLRRNRFGEIRNSLENVTMRKSSLKTVDLGENELSSLPWKLFSNSFDLHTLYLDGNKLSDCKQLDLLSSRPVLETLDLSNNLLVSPKKKCFASFANLKSLDLSGNPFLCNCPLFEFSMWLQSTDLTDHSRQDYNCAAPSFLANKNIFSYNPSNFDCPEFREAFLIVCLSLCIATLAFLAGAFCSLYLNSRSSSHRPSVSHHGNHSLNGKYTPLSEDNASKHAASSSEHISCDSSEPLIDDDNNSQQQTLVGCTSWKLNGKQKIMKTKNIFAENEKSFWNFAKKAGKRKHLSSLKANEASLLRPPERVGEVRESELTFIDGGDLGFRVTPAPSFECQVHVEDSVL